MKFQKMKIAPTPPTAKRVNTVTDNEQPNHVAPSKNGVLRNTYKRWRAILLHRAVERVFHSKLNSCNLFL